MTMEPRFNGPLARWWRRTWASLAAPDPWTAAEDAAAREAAAVSLCTNCLYPQDRHTWFCPRCGFTSGEYVHLMPYLYVFTWGEVLRRGVSGPPEPGFWRKFGSVVLSVLSYVIFAPAYWYWMVRKARGRPICERWSGPRAGGGEAEPST